MIETFLPERSTTRYWLSVVLISIIMGMAIHPVYAQRLNTIIELAYTPSQNLIALGRGDETVELQDATTNQSIATLPNPDPLAEERGLYRISELAFSPDGTHLAITYGGYGNDGLLQVVSIPDMQLVQAISAGDFAGHIAWNPAGDRVAVKVVSGLGNPTRSNLMVWAIPSGNQIADVYMGANTFEIGLDWHPDSTRLVSLERSRQIVIRDTSTWQETSPEIRSSLDMVDVAWNNDGSAIIGVDVQRAVHVWDALDGTLLNTFSSVTTTESVHWLDVNSQDSVVLRGRSDIAVVNINTGASETIDVSVPVDSAIWIDETTISYTQGDILEKLRLTDEPQTPNQFSCPR